MIDKFFFWLLASIDNFFQTRCKTCKCKCHCEDVLHPHWYDGDLCTCDKCKH